jgi:hypothetical protein
MRTILVKLKADGPIYMSTIEELMIVSPPPNMSQYSIEVAFKKGKLLMVDDGQEDDI